VTTPDCSNKPPTDPSGALADYLIIWIDYAQAQYLALVQDVSAQLNRSI